MKSSLVPKVYSLRFFRTCTMIDERKWTEDYSELVSTGRKVPDYDIYYVAEIERLVHVDDDYAKACKINNHLSVHQLGVQIREVYGLAGWNKSDHAAILVKTKRPHRPVFKHIVHVAGSGNIGIDIHLKNYMLRNVRGRRQIVFTDPLI
jgi:hypothetical protein